MEHKKQATSKRRLSKHEEEFIREVDYDSTFESNIIYRKRSDHKISSIISLPTTKPDVKTLYMSQKNFSNNKDSITSTSLFSDGVNNDDYPCFNQHANEGCLNKPLYKSFFIEGTQTCTKICPKHLTYIKSLKKPGKYVREVCEMCNHTQLNMNLPKANCSKSGRIDKATLIVTNTSSDESINHYDNIINRLQKRIDELERKVQRQEVVFRAMDASFTSVPSVEIVKNDSVHADSMFARPECSYVEQYNQMPETSGFQRDAKRMTLPPSKASSVATEQNHEKYSRNFTTYDGITTRGRRCASVPLKRLDVPTKAADRVQKIRHKLNPVRDYKLMDTVHYLAQGEFAPRDDGIKLTPSREAVLSDIIWEDVCRTHWPNTRLVGRRTTHRERVAARAELQRLVDNLLRDRVAHAERRRRKQYRIIRLNQSTVGNVGKTGDIIVASNKYKNSKRNKHISNSDHCTVTSSKNDLIRCPKINRNSDRQLPETSRRRHIVSHDECLSGPDKATTSRCNENVRKGCPIASTSKNVDRSTFHRTNEDSLAEETTCTSNLTTKPQVKNAKYIVKRDNYGMRHTNRARPGVEHYILLPTLVVRTPSNVRRQKKFNELYHRIINFHRSENGPHETSDDAKDANQSEHTSTPLTKDVGLNFNIVLSESEQNLS